MNDTNNVVIKAVYEALTSVLDDTPVYEGMEPDNATDSSYVVIKYPVNVDASTKSSTDYKSTIQIDVHTLSEKSVRSKYLNTICDKILQSIVTEPNRNLDLGSGFQMLNTRLFNDRTVGPDQVGNRFYLTRNLIFEYQIYIK